TGTHKSRINRCLINGKRPDLFGFDLHLLTYLTQQSLLPLLSQQLFDFFQPLYFNANLRHYEPGSIPGLVLSLSVRHVSVICVRSTSKSIFVSFMLRPLHSSLSSICITTSVLYLIRKVNT